MIKRIKECKNRLIIGYDYTNGKDRTVLVVAKEVDEGIEIVNEFKDEEAEQLYKKLIGENK